MSRARHRERADGGPAPACASGVRIACGRCTVTGEMEAGGHIGLEAGPGRFSRESAIRLMAETLPLAGYGGVRADLPGWELPELIHGALQDHRPSLSCQLPRPVFFDVVAAEGSLTLEDLASRWQLFSSAAELTKGEFHVVAPRWVAGRDGRQLAKQIAELVGVRIGYIWAI